MPKHILAALLPLLIMAGLILASRRVVTVPRAAEAVERLRGAPGSLAVFATAASALAIVKPTALIPITAAMLFGFWGGLSVTVASVNLGAWAGFWLGARWRRRSRAAPDMGPGVEWMVERVGRRGIWRVALIRLLGFPPAGLVQVASGMSGLAFRDFALGTLAGMAPWALLMSYSSDRLWSALIH